jgi:tetratricopeptide (TPR) repeat protein
MRAIITTLTLIGIVALLTGPVIGATEEDWVDKGLKLISQQRYDDAVKAFSTAIEIIPGDYQAYNYRGVAQALKGEFDGAIADYDKALKIRPRYAEAYNNRGFVRTQKGNLQGALNDYSRALEINPFFVDAYNNKAWILCCISGYAGSCECSCRQLRIGHRNPKKGHSKAAARGSSFRGA